MATTTRPVGNYDPAPQPTDPREQRLILPPRPRVSNAAWDAMRMLRAAGGKIYPGAEGTGQAAELAYWRTRVAWEAAEAAEETPP